MTQPTTSAVDTDVIWLTQEAHDKLQAQLDNLRGPVREEIVARIAAAREGGDLREHGGRPSGPGGSGTGRGPGGQLREISAGGRPGAAPRGGGLGGTRPGAAPTR